MQLSIVGVDHRTADLAVREQLHLDGPTIDRLLAAIRTTFPGCEAFVLSTCNRTELLFAEPDGGRAAEAWHLLVREALGVSSAEPNEPCGHATAHRYRHEGPAAARHMIRVAAGLDSAVLGDVEILGQVRDAMARAQDAGTLGKHLHRLLRQALQAGKAVRTETDLSIGGAGVGSAVASIVRDRVPTDGHVVLVGAGTAARAVGTQLAKQGYEQITVANRTPANAEALAGRIGASVIGLTDLPGALATADAVVALVAGGDVILDSVTLDRAVDVRAGGRLLAVDACVPRAVAPHPDVDLVPLDAIAERQTRVRRRRETAVPAAERIVDDAVVEYVSWCQQARLDDVAAALFAAADGVVEAAADVLDDAALQELRTDVRRAVHKRISALRARAKAAAHA